MPSYLVQGGTTLKKMSTAGVLTSLTLPTGVALDNTKRLRGVVLGRQVILVNSPNVNLSVDMWDVVRPLCPPRPGSVPVLTKAASGGLSGTFKVKETFVVKDEFGNLIAESPFGTASAASATLASEYLIASGLSICPVTITGLSRRVYRTTTGPGSTYYPWIDVDGNKLTTVQNDLTDAGLQLVAAPTDLGAPPVFELIAEWKDRIWGKSKDARDTLYYSAIDKPYAFASTNTIPIPPAKRDNRGITGFLARKDELGVGRADSLHKIAGTTTNFTRSKVAESIGVWASDSCQVIHDVGYFFGNPFGVYKWDASGLKNISNEKVRAWFESDTYFNRAQFENAYGCYDPTMNAYVLFLAAAGSTNLDRWVAFDIGTQTWWGPHKTGEFTPTGGVTLVDANSTPIFVAMGSDGKLYKSQTTKTDGAATAIDFDCDTNFLSGGTPGIYKTWLDPEIVTEIQSGGTLTVTPKVGNRNASAGAAISHDMTKGNERLRILGDGIYCQLKLRENTAGQDVTVYGLEIPFFENGRRS
jgi:hypothetical protein